MTLTKKTRYFIIPFIAIVAFWLGGYSYFKASEDWSAIKKLLAENPVILLKVGQVKEITVSPIPFMYRFSGDAGSALLRINVTGSTGEHRATIELKKLNGVWSLSS